jgi:Ala-tRNA(Pro) deacylase
MISSDRLLQVLVENKMPHEVIKHPEAFTAQEVAHAIHKTGKVLAKTVILDVDGRHVMAVVPAHHRVKLEAVKALLKADAVRLAAEEQLRALFPDCDLGAMPPIGTLYNLPVVVSTELAEKPEIIFNACSHTECVKMTFKDFEALVRPQVGSISEIRGSTP